MLEFPSKIGLGTWQFSGIDPDSPGLAEAESVFRAAHERGVRHVDTAQSYGDGVSESVVGRLLGGFADVFVATKLHLKPSAAGTVQAVEASRRRLGRDIIDLMYLHWPRKGQDLRPVMEGWSGPGPWAGSGLSVSAISRSSRWKRPPRSPRSTRSSSATAFSGAGGSGTSFLTASGRR
ncbi:MAG: aldo/keto reductase [Candidatus Competibacteraceae bacterium]|nr:aldo/keto reductase [Candidatus Competibacteraceae bacterium]